MPINESGYTLTVGPDRDGNFFDVAHGESYELPQLDPDPEPEPAPAATADTATAETKTRAKPKTSAATADTATDGGPTE